jgi:hypothetical protein
VPFPAQWYPFQLFVALAGVKVSKAALDASASRRMLFMGVLPLQARKAALC